jgi:hypothetical protein
MRTSASGESALLLLDVVQVLSREQVDYAIVGAMAASVYGVIRASRDADALLSISVPALTGLERTFRYGAHTVRSLENLLGDLVPQKDSGLELD